MKCASIVHHCLVLAAWSLLCISSRAAAAGEAVDLAAPDRGLTATDVKPLLLAEEGNDFYRGVAQRNFKGSVLGYVTPWNGRGYDVAVRWRAKFSHISPVWYQLKPAASGQGFELHGGHDVDQGWLGRLREPVTEDAACANGDASSQTCSSNGGTSTRPPLIVPRVLFELSPQALLQLLQQPSDALTLMVDEVKKQGFDGLVVEAWLQWSAMQALDNEEFRKAALAMLAWLADLLHAEGKVLILAVPPVVPAQPGRPAAEVEHLQQLSSRVDGWSLMTYDYSAAGPGPNAPLPWQEENVKAVTAGLAEGAAPVAQGVPADKVLMGLNFYGYDFTRPDEPAAAGGGKVKRQQQAQASAIMGESFLKLLRRAKLKLVWQAEHAEHRARYKEGGVRHTVYFPTPAALAARVRLAEQLGAGLSIWELGQGIDSFMDLL